MNKMNKLMMVVGAVLAAVVMMGCATGGAAGEDKVAAWQKERTPVEVLQSKIEVKAAGAVVEALDVVPFGLYKAVADKVDKAAVMERCRRIYMGYVGDVQELEKQGKSRDEARKAVLDQVRAQKDGAETIAKLNEYLKVAKETNFEAAVAWIQRMTQEIQVAAQKFAAESPNAMQQLMAIAQQEGGMAVIKIPAQGKDDLSVVGAQLADAGKGVAIYAEMVNADREAAKVQADYPIEG